MEKQKPINNFRDTPVIVERTRGEVKADRDLQRKADLLNTPGPYEQSWLDAKGLDVIYQHGKAVLQFRK